MEPETTDTVQTDEAGLVNLPRRHSKLQEDVPSESESLFTQFKSGVRIRGYALEAVSNLHRQFGRCQATGHNRPANLKVGPTTLSYCDTTYQFVLLCPPVLNTAEIINIFDGKDPQIVISFLAFSRDLKYCPVQPSVRAGSSVAASRPLRPTTHVRRQKTVPWPWLTRAFLAST